MTKVAYPQTGLEMAIIGMSVRVPGADNLSDFWHNLLEGKDCISHFDDDTLLGAGVDKVSIAADNYVKAKGILDKGMGFDSAFFNYSHVEAQIMDPQLRVYHEVVYQALADAGYSAQHFDGAIGLYGGAGLNPKWSAQFLLGNIANAAAGYQVDNLNSQEYFNTRVAHSLNFKGPAVTVMTACSSALVAVHMAAQALIAGDCDLALAGGVEMFTSAWLKQPDVFGYAYQPGMVVSPDGACRPFDVNGAGTVFSDGAACVALKRLDDAVLCGDHIYAVLKATAINNDGNAKVGFTAPSVEGQAAVVRAALEMGEIDPATIGYIETHGTGTSLGDPIEIKALTQAYDLDDVALQSPIHLGSVKANIGHLGAGAGGAGLIKAVLSIYHGVKPPCVNFESANPALGLEDTPFRVNQQPLQWQDLARPLRSGVSSFGIGGTNAHVVVEEYLAPLSESTQVESTQVESTQVESIQCVVITATHASALTRQLQALKDDLAQRSDVSIKDIAVTLQQGRKHQAQRIALVANSTEQLLAQLTEAIEQQHSGLTMLPQSPKLVFMFPGQGAQYFGMGAEIGAQLYQYNDAYRQAMDECFALMESKLADKLRQLTEDEVNKTEYTQPLLFTIEYALARALQAFGFTPWAMIGHSIGEYVAATIAGVLSLADALRLVVARGRLMASTQAGAMLAVSLDEDKLTEVLKGQFSDFCPAQLVIAAVNGKARTVVSGSIEAIDALEVWCDHHQVMQQRLHTSHAFHSPLMQPIMDEFAALFASIDLQPPQQAYISNLTGDWISQQQATDPHYWCQHLAGTVKFSHGINTILNDSDDVILIELGPGRTLSSFAKTLLADKSSLPCVQLLPNRHGAQPTSYDASVAFTQGIGQIFCYGVEPDWSGFEQAAGLQVAKRLSLPGYVFDRQLFIPQPLDAANIATQSASQAGGHHAPQVYLPCWHSEPLAAGQSLDLNQLPKRWLLLGFEQQSQFIDKVSAALKDQQLILGLTTDTDSFNQIREHQFSFARNNAQHWLELFKQLQQSECLPEVIVCAWDLTDSEDDSFWAIVLLAKAMGQLGVKSQIRLCVVSQGVHQVTGEDHLVPKRAMLLALVRVISQEYRNILAQNIDFGHKLSVKQLLDELVNYRYQQFVAYRGAMRWQRQFEVSSDLSQSLLDGQSSSERLAFELADNEHIVITGGLGGIGLQLAQALAQSQTQKTSQQKTLGQFNHLRLTLLGRKQLPAKAYWQEYIDGHQQDDAVAMQLNALMAIEQSGCQLLVINSDVTQYQQLSDALDLAIAQQGVITGVVHAAGVPGGGMMQLRSHRQLQQVLAAKVQGTDNLARFFNHATFQSNEQQPPLQWLVLCSSITALIGGLGQVDYCAANAYLDAIAHSECFGSSTKVTSINFDPWVETGMAVNSARAGELAAIERQHPLLGGLFMETEQQITFKARFSADELWVLFEHKIMGLPTVPGSGYLEMARAAWQLLHPNVGVHLSEVYFLAPLALDFGQSRVVSTELNTTADGYQFVISSRIDAGSGNKVVQHARGKLSAVGKINSATEIDIDSMWHGTRQCQINDIKTQNTDSSALQALSCGRRWDVFKQVAVRDEHDATWAVAQFQLADDLAFELEQYPLHPALLDCAAAFMRPLIEAEFFYPLYYRSLNYLGPLSACCYAKAVPLASVDKDLLEFDVAIYNQQGQLVVDIQGFSMKRMTEKTQPTVEALPVKEELTALNPDVVKQGLTNQQGILAFKLALQTHLPQLVVTTFDLPNKIDSLEQISAEDLSGDHTAKAKAPRPTLTSAYMAAQNQLEQRLVDLWQSQLGIEKIGVLDEFFELGGDSLVLMQIHAELGDLTDQSVPIAALYQHTTIRALASSLDDEADSQGTQQIKQADQRAEQMKKAMRNRRRRR